MGDAIQAAAAAACRILRPRIRPRYLDQPIPDLNQMSKGFGTTRTKMCDDGGLPVAAKWSTTSCSPTGRTAAYLSAMRQPEVETTRTIVAYPLVRTQCISNLDGILFRAQ